MSSTHYQRSVQGSSDKAGFSGLATFAIATVMLAVGIAIGSMGWLETATQPGAGVERSSVAAPAEARKYNDWRGNSAGIRQEPGSTE